jgi:hypothetical protein
MLAPRWLKYVKDAIAFDKKVNNAVTKDKAAIVALTAVTAPNATDLTSAQTLANANKVAINAVIAALKA